MDPMEVRASHVNYLLTNSVFPIELGLMKNLHTLDQFDRQSLDNRLTNAFRGWNHWHKTQIRYLILIVWLYVSANEIQGTRPTKWSFNGVI